MLPRHQIGVELAREAPVDAEVIASSDFCRYAGFSYKGKAMSLQPHPEFERARSMVRLRAEEIWID